MQAADYLVCKRQYFYGHLPFSTGGVLGNLVGFGLAATVNKIGATILLFGLFLSGITLFTGFSWMTVITVAGYLTLLGFSGAVSVLSFIEQKRSSNNNGKDKKSIKIEREPILNYSDQEPFSKRKSNRVEPQITPVTTQRFDIPIINEPAPLTALLNSTQATSSNFNNKKKDIPLPNTRTFNKIKSNNGELPSLDLLDPQNVALQKVIPMLHLSICPEKLKCV